MRKSIAISSLSKSIIKILLYYDIFNYPLKSTEVFRFLGTNHVNEHDVEEGLIALRDKGLIFQYEDFFTLQNNEHNIARRRKGNMEAEKYLELARRKGKLIMSFPFVRAVLASGSLSKGYMDENSDLDFFIVTSPGRLWVARMLLVIYKRIFLFNSHKFFCVNYFVDMDHLEIEEKNIFTATELATVIPLHGAECYRKLQMTNSWIMKFFPNYQPRSTEGVPPATLNGLKKFCEGLFNLIMGNWLNRFFMKLTLRRWKKLYQRHYAYEDFQVAFKTKEYVSKNHPKQYQKKIVVLYEEKLRNIESQLFTKF